MPTDRTTQPGSDRPTGILLIGAAVVSLALLAAHPGDHAGNFTEVLKNEAAQRIIDALVHGGFIIILAVQCVCYARFSQRLGVHRMAAVAGLIFFAIGSAFLGFSMLLDGLVTPAIAARYLPTPDKVENARSLFVLIGALIGFLMPFGLGFQSAGVAAWGWALIEGGTARITGALGLTLGLAALAALGAFNVVPQPFAWILALLATMLWAFVAGIWLLKTVL
jgi:hypothetical protein